jgi:hypothetical protein
MKRALALLCLALPASLLSDALLRGPYLQQGTPQSMIVRWRTAQAGASLVRYGLKPGALDHAVSLTPTTTEHRVKVQGLEPATRYYYSVGSGGRALAGPSRGHYFVTSPLPGAKSPTQAWILGDAGTKDCAQRQVRDAYLDFMGKERTDLVLQLGDNAYDAGKDEEYQKSMFQGMYEGLLKNTVFWSCLGNHETYGGKPYAYWEIYDPPTNGEAGGMASGTKNYYSFDQANIHFIALDSMESDRKKGGAMYRWLKADLESTSQDWIVAFFHHPPYTKGSHDSDLEIEHIEMRENFLPLLESQGVDLVLSGHSHCYERSYFLDGHYGKSQGFGPKYVKQPGQGWDDHAYTKPQPGKQAHAGAVYVVAGNAGHASGGALNHPANTVSLNVIGSLMLNVEGGRLDAAELDIHGEIRDAFTLLKGKDAASSKMNAAAQARLAHIKAAMAKKTHPGGGILFDFEDGVQGFASSGKALTPSSGTATVFHGGKSLAVGFESPGGDKIEGTVKTTQGLGKLKRGATLTFHAWIPGGGLFSGVEPYYSDANGNWVGAYEGGYDPGAWNSFSLPIACDAALPIKEVGFFLFGAKAGKAVVYLDALETDR